MWKKSNILLKVQCIESGKTLWEQFGTIGATDEAEGLLVFWVDGEHRTLDLSGAELSCEEERVSATQDVGDWIVFTKACIYDATPL